MKAKRDRLVAKYVAGGVVDYDIAVGIKGATAESEVAGLASTRVVSGVTLNVITYKGTAYNVEKALPVFQPDAVIGATAAETIRVPDFDQIKAYNQARGVASGSMLDALAKFGSGKVVELGGASESLGYGGIVLGTVSCMLRITSDIRNVHGRLFPARVTEAGKVWAGGGANNTRDAVETATLQYRGKFKIRNYRGTPEMLSHEASLWATKDKSGLSQFQFGINSLIRMYGSEQIIDLNSFRISHHERPNRFAGFSALIDLANGHFAGLTDKSAKDAHIFCSKGTGTLGRNNHFAVRGHFVDGLLIDSVTSGTTGSLNEGSYFGTVLLNKSSRICVKNLKQNQLNQSVILSSAGLSAYNQLTSQEVLYGYFETVPAWNSLVAPGVTRSAMYPWLIWEDKDAAQADTFGNGKKTPYPRLKAAAELESTSGISALADKTAVAAKISEALEAAKVAHSKASISADDVYVQTHTAISLNHPAWAGGQMPSASPLAIPHTTNGVWLNPANQDGVRYPDSVAYSFRIGAASEGVGPLAEVEYLDQAGAPRLERPVKEVHIMDSALKAMHLSPMEAVSLGVVGKGLTKTFNGMALRPFGYSNSNSFAQGIASALLLMSKDAMEEASPRLRLEAKSVDQFDTAAFAVANAPSSGFTAKSAHGLYKGNDIAESSLALIEAIGLLRKYFVTSASSPAGFIIGGLDNSAVDIGILALRKSMMTALGAKTANQVGLRGGYQSNPAKRQLWATDAAASGSGSIEIYPWLVTASASIDKDSEFTVQQLDNSATPAQIKANRKLSHGYIASTLPSRSASLLRLRMKDADTMELVKCSGSAADGSDDAPVTYQECADLLGFTTTSMGAPANMAAAVQYKIVRNLDGQNHVHKGGFAGVRVDEAEQVSISNLLVSDAKTTDARPGTEGLGTRATQIAFGVNTPSEPESGVLKIHGVAISSCEYVEISDVKIADSAAGGRFVGVEIRGKSEKVSVENVEVSNLSSVEKVVGVRVANDCSDVKVKGVKASGLTGEHPGLALPVEIESASTKLE